MWWWLAACSPGVADLPDGWSVTVLPEMPHGVRIEVAAAGPFAIQCQADDDRWSASHGPDDARDLQWIGLLLGETYLCDGWLDGRWSHFAFATPAPSPDLPSPTITGQTAGWTLFNHVRAGEGQKIVLIDGRGRVRWHRYLEGDPNTGIESAFLSDSPVGPVVLVGGGEGYAPALIRLDGTVAWSAGSSAGGGVFHHDAGWIPDETSVLGLSWSVNQANGRSWDGFALETVDVVTDTRTWEWNSQQAVDAGTLPWPSDDPDAYHANAVTWHPEDPDGLSVWASVKRLHQIAAIDVATGAIRWKLGVGGDFTLLDAAGAPADPAAWFYGQHAPEPHLVDPAGIWSVWVHDNGMDRPGALYSRVAELRVDVPARTAAVAWSWTEPGWYEPVFGDVDLLDDGHVLVTMGHCSACADAPPDRVTTLVELDPSSGAVVWRAEMETPDEGGYRAARVDPAVFAPPAGASGALPSARRRPTVAGEAAAGRHSTP
jgi:hypothetical protein